MIIEFAHDPRETRFQKKADDLFFQELSIVSCHGSFLSDVGMVLAFFRSLNCTAAGKKCNYLLFFLCLFLKNNY